MIKRLLALGLISGLLVAGGFAISGHVNHQSSKYQTLLAQNTQSSSPKNSSPKNYQLYSTTGTYYMPCSGDQWTYGLSPSGNSAVSIVYPMSDQPVNPYIGYAMSGVINGNGQSAYSPLVFVGTNADVYLPNVSGPNTYEGASQNYNQAYWMQWYNEYNNSGAVQQESAYPLSNYTNN